MIDVLRVAMILALLSPGADCGEPMVPLRVDPMPEPKPALKYQLLPDVSELNPGNAAQDYLKCFIFMEQRIFFFSRKQIDERTRYLTMPLAELASAKLRGYGGNAFRQADWAARLEGVDWQVVPLIQSGKLEAPPAGLGPLQTLALALNVRFRAEVAEQHYEDAIRTAKTMFALGRHLGEYPSATASQVGIWVVNLGLGTLKEMLQQPGCPNLYWALTDLPVPLVDLRRGVHGDRTLVAAELLRPIRDDVLMSQVELETCVAQLSGVIGFAREQVGLTPRSLRARLAELANAPDTLDSARRRLIEAGSAADFIEKLRPLQVILLDEKRTFEIKRDARIKLVSLPLRPTDLSLRSQATPGEQTGPFDHLLPDIATLRRNQGSLGQEIALLRHVEALRLHAATHSGRLPAALAEISVPLPVDPCTGKPFDYNLEGAVAHLRGRSCQDDEDESGRDLDVHVAVTLRN